jgi:hypothetical protein
MVAPRPNAQLAPMEGAAAPVNLRMPTLNRHAWQRAPSTQQLVELIRDQFIAFSRDDDAIRVLCATPNPASAMSQKQARIDALEEFAKNTTGFLTSTYTATKGRVVRRHPEFVPYVITATGAWGVGSDTALDEGLLWLFTEVLASRVCAQRDRVRIAEDEAALLAMAAVQWVNSAESLYRAYFEALNNVPGSRPSDFFWSHQRASIESLGTLFDALVLASVDDGSNASWGSVWEYSTVARNTVVSTGAGTLQLECRPEVRIETILSPVMIRAGGDIPRDAQAVIYVQCFNKSTDVRLFSESVVSNSARHPCMAEVSDEKQLSEMDPKHQTTESTSTMRLGPYLFTESCPSTVRQEYKVVSSQHSGELSLAVTFTLRDATWVAGLSAIDEDLPGSSELDSDVGKIGPGDHVEFQVVGQGSSDFEYKVVTFDPVLPSTKGVFTSVVDMPVLFRAQGASLISNDDIDLFAVEGTDWESFEQTRRKKRDRPQHVLDLDDRNLWHEVGVNYSSSCRLSASEMPGEIGRLYADLCSRVTLVDYIDLLDGLFEETCAQGDKVIAGPGYRQLIDPQYIEVAQAVVGLAEMDLLRERELDVALAYLDGLVVTPLHSGPTVLPPPAGFSREKARQLILAHEFAKFVRDALGEEEVKKTNVFAVASPRGISTLRERIVEIVLKKELKNRVEAFVRRDRILRAWLITAVGKVNPAISKRMNVVVNEMFQMEGASCQSPPKIPTPTARSYFSATRYLPIRLEAPQ